MSVTGLRSILSQYTLHKSIQNPLIFNEYMLCREVLDGCYFLHPKFIIPEKDTRFCRIVRTVYRSTDVFYYNSNQITGICFSNTNNKVYLTQSQLFKIDELSGLWHTIPIFDHNSLNITTIYNKDMLVKIVSQIK